MDKLGIEPKLLLAQVINFTVIVLILNKLLYKPILQMIEKRKKEIAEGLSLTDTMRLEEEKLKEKQEKALAKAREDALLIIEDAKKQAKDVEKELVSEAHTQAESIIARSKTEAEEVKRQARDDIRREAVDLAVLMSKRFLSSALSAKEQHAFIEKRIRDLEDWAVKEEKKKL